MLFGVHNSLPDWQSSIPILAFYLTLGKSDNIFNEILGISKEQLVVGVFHPEDFG